MKLTAKQQRALNGEVGPALQWAMEFHVALGYFFDAPELVPISSAHFAPDTRLAGDSGRELLEGLVGQGAKVSVPSYLDPCSVDFERAAELVRTHALQQEFVDADRHTQRLCRQLGFLPTYTCINYQTISPPVFGEHLAWGDTGAAICANALFGARSNFEGGPSALASALTGLTPLYGMHATEQRRGNLHVRIECEPTETSDWGAIAALSGEIKSGYKTVPVLSGSFPKPTFDMLKHLGVALASFGGHAMFHVVGATPEAPTLDTAFGTAQAGQEYVLTQEDLDGVYQRWSLPNPSVDVVVFAAPQLSIAEVRTIAMELADRRVHGSVKMILAVDPQVKAQADLAGLTPCLEEKGAEFTTGTCFYPEAPLLRQAMGWNNLVTTSAKLVNTLASAGYHTSLRRLNDCVTAAIRGRLDE